MLCKYAFSFLLISVQLSPEILAQALTLKFLSCKYLAASMSADMNMRRPHCITRDPLGPWGWPSRI